MLPRRSAVRRLLIGLAALPLVAELGFRAAGLDFRFRSACELIDDRGCIMPPHLDERVAVAREGFRYTTNSRGLRNRAPVPEDAARRHVVVLGDSVAFGAGVNDDDVFTAVLDRRLAPAGIAVINAASMFLKGTEQQLRFLVDERAVLRADLVVLVFTAQNDVADNSREDFYRDGVPQPWRPRLLQRIVKGSERVPGFGLLTEHSRVFGLISFSWFNVHTRFGESPGGWRLQPTETVLRQVRDDCGAHAAKLVIVLIPRRDHLAERLRDGRYAGETDETSVEAMAERLGIRLFDAAEVVGAMATTGNLTQAGHQSLADALEERLFQWL